MKWINIALVCMLLSLSVQAQDSTQFKLKPLVIAGSSAYLISLVALNQLWYADFERQPFQFFNDNAEWKQIDKLGHFYSAFHISQFSYKQLSKTHLSNKKSILWGALVSAIVLTPIEVFDGFSAEYGASVGDLVANTTGAMLFAGQQALWNEIRIHPKYSFNRTNYPQLRPEILGSNLSEELLKDYNAQHYWLSIDLSKFNKKLPKWLNLAVGYGATDMVYARDSENEINGFNAQRQFFIALDFDFNEYKSRSRLINTLFYVVNMVKLPAPTLEIKENKIKLHSFYY